MAFFNTGEHPDYHTANDTWDRINYPKMEKICGSSTSRRVTWPRPLPGPGS